MSWIRVRLVKILHWSEQYTKTDMKYLARGGFLSLFFQGVNIIASLALAVAVSHLVSKESYGIYKYALSIVTILSLFSLNSIGSAVFQSAAQGFDGALRRAFWDNIRWSFAIFVGAFLFGAYYLFTGNSTLGIGIFVGGLCTPFMISTNLFSSFLGGKKDFERQTIYGIYDSVIPIAIFVIIIFFTQDPLILILTYFLTNTLAGWFFYRRTIAAYHTSLHTEDHDMLRYGKHLSVMGILTGIASNLDQILLFHYVGAAQLAIYNFATAIPDQIKGPSKTLDAMLQAQLVHRTGDEIRSGMTNKTLWYFLCCALIAMTYIAIAPYLFALLFPNYAGAVFYSQVYALWILTVAFDPYTTYLSARRLVREQYIYNVAYTIIQTVGMFIGVIFWGLLGIVVARVITRLALGFVYYLLYRYAIARETSLVI
ncbi:MAG: oligosaccharide flippase family protein [Candidatus Pacebacteria bacterium]|nr:oligosaccharide flippase family protein [Candidatus Paceibacterota bacterium]